MEWFIATAFNHGLDLHDRNDAARSKTWVGFALTLAHYCRDDGKMEKLLQDQCAKVKWD